MNIENLSTLKIHKLTQAQYDRELAAGNIDENAIYLTPDEEIKVPTKTSQLENDSGFITLDDIPSGSVGGATIDVDSTLTVEGAAADAKATGDRLSLLENYVTPQMFGAVGDGETDDTVAIQTALNQGGVIYFPAGVYKVTKQLTTTKPCVIKMFKQYPSKFWRSGNTSGRYDYPIKITEGEIDYETEKGWDFGARIECYPSEGENYGFLIGDGCEVDGLFMRAMNGFSGVLLKYDNSHQYGTDNLGDSITYSSYPSAARFKNIRLDCDRHNHETTIPESMFDFYPKNNYFYVLDDIVIGQGDEFATYGFRSIIDPTIDRWANSVRINNLCLNGLFDYPLYVEEGCDSHSLTNWIFEGLSIQTYGYNYDDFQRAMDGHKAVVTLKRLNYCLFSGCYIWDLFAAKYVRLFDCENLNNISCVGCSEEFDYGTKKLVGDDGEDGIETVLRNRLQEAGANVKTLVMSTSVAEDGGNRVNLSDNYGNTIYTDLPPVALSDEQLSEGIGSWMDDNAAPIEQEGKNKLNIYSEDMKFGYAVDKNGKPLQATVGSPNAPYIVTHFIPVKQGDIFRMSHNGQAFNWSEINEYDKDLNFLTKYTYSDEAVGTGYSIAIKHSDTAYIMVSCNTKGFMTEEEKTAGIITNLEVVERMKLCVTLNNSDISYEMYGIKLVGGLSQYFLLQSPNGTQYSVAVTDDGVVVGKDKDGNIVGSTIPVKTSQLENDSGFVTVDDIPNFSNIPTKVSQLENDSKFVNQDELFEASDISDITEMVNVDGGITLFDSNTDELVSGGYVNTTEYSTAFTNNISLPPLDVSGYSNITVRVNSFTPGDSTATSRSLYMAYLDVDFKVLVVDDVSTRTPCNLKGIKTSIGEIVDYETSNLVVMGSGVNTHAYGGIKTFEVPRGAKYLSLFNMKQGDTIDIKVYIEDLDKVRKIKSSALPELSIPTKTSQLENDSGFVNTDYVDQEIENCETALTEQINDLTGRVEEVENAVNGMTVDSTELNTMLEEVLI